MSTKGEQWYQNRLKSPEWRKVKEIIILRDGYICSIRFCRKRKNLEFHHLSYENLGSILEVDDVVILCSNHHKKANFRRTGKVPLNRYELTKRYNELQNNAWLDIHPSDVFDFIGSLM